MSQDRSEWSFVDTCKARKRTDEGRSGGGVRGAGVLFPEMTAVEKIFRERSWLLTTGKRKFL